MSDELVFDDISLIEEPVKIAGEEYVLREASGDAAVKYQNAVTKCSRFVDGKYSGIQGDLASTQPMLVSLCLFKRDRLSDGSSKYIPVAEATIKGWPNRVQRKLFDRIKEVSMLDEVDTEESLQEQIIKLQKRLEAIRGDRLKNLPSGTTDGSD